jgi:hypothetical protein
MEVTVQLTAVKWGHKRPLYFVNPSPDILLVKVWDNCYIGREVGYGEDAESGFPIKQPK